MKKTTAISLSKNYMKALLILSFTIVGLLGCNKSVPSQPVDENIPTTAVCNQVWMTKNLDVAFYRNGDAIPQVTDSLEWGNLTTGAWCYYNNDAANGRIYGKLYNWYAVNDSRGLAPAGYHVSSDIEWTSLVTCLGGGDSTAGGKIKEAGLVHWLSPNAGATNSSGITCLPAGGRDYDGSFLVINSYAFLWSSTKDSSGKAWARSLYSGDSLILRFNDLKVIGYSVRCLKD
jgi:uncharacterized protein (TIGR02145 family)